MRKQELYSGCIVSPRENDKYQLIQEFKYKEVTVPVGYKTNGADVPRILWSIFPPNRSTYLPAVIVHDYLTHIKQYKLANKYFNEILEILDVGTATKFSFKWSTWAYFKVTGKD